MVKYIYYKGLAYRADMPGAPVSQAAVEKAVRTGGVIETVPEPTPEGIRKKQIEQELQMSFLTLAAAEKELARQKKVVSPVKEPVKERLIETGFYPKEYYRPGQVGVPLISGLPAVGKRTQTLLERREEYVPTGAREVAGILYPEVKAHEEIAGRGVEQVKQFGRSAVSGFLWSPAAIITTPVATAIGVQEYGPVGYARRQLLGLKEAVTKYPEATLGEVAGTAAFWYGLGKIGKPKVKTEAIELGKITRKGDITGIKSRVVTVAGKKKYVTDLETVAKKIGKEAGIQKTVAKTGAIIKEVGKKKERIGYAGTIGISKPTEQFTVGGAITGMTVKGKKFWGATGTLTKDLESSVVSAGKAMTGKGVTGKFASILRKVKPPEPGISYIPGRPTVTRPFTDIIGSVAKATEAAVTPSVPKLFVPPTIPREVRKPVKKVVKVEKPIELPRLEVKLKKEEFPKAQVTYPHKITISRQWAGLGEITGLGKALKRTTRFKREVGRGYQVAPKQISLQLPRQIQPLAQPSAQSQKQMQQQLTGLKQMTKTVTEPIEPFMLMRPTYIPSLDFRLPRVKKKKRKKKKRKYPKRKLRYIPSLAGIVGKFTIPKAPKFKRITGLELRPMVKRRRRKR